MAKRVRGSSTGRPIMVLLDLLGGEADAAGLVHGGHHLLGEAEQWRRPTHERFRKESYHYSMYQLQSRMVDGTARKRDRR